MTIRVCGYQWHDSTSTTLHDTHVCGEKTDGRDHTHMCAALNCGAVK